MPAPDGAISATDCAGRELEARAVQDLDRRFAPPVPALHAIERERGDARGLIHSAAPRPDRAWLRARTDRSSPRSDRKSASATTASTSRASTARGQLRQEIEFGRKEVGAGKPAQALADRLDVVGDEEPEHEADGSADEPDRRAGDEKDAHDRAPRRAHGAEDCDGARLVLHQHDEAGDDVERSHQHDQRQNGEHHIALDRQHVEKAAVELAPVGVDHRPLLRRLDFFAASRPCRRDRRHRLR